MRFNFNNFNYKKFGIIFGSVIICFYFLFLVLPLVVSPFVNSYGGEIEKAAKEMLGLEVKINKLGIYTTPLLRVGIKAQDITILIPDKNDSILKIDKPRADIKLIPLLAKQVELGKISACNLNINLSLNNKGDFEILEYLPAQQPQQEQMTSLPFGLKLSNHLPDVKINNYKVELANIDTKKSYFVEGSEFNISNFILDKSVKLFSKGNVVFDGRVISNYDLKINNKIMPNVALDDIVFPKEVKIEQDNNIETAKKSDFKFNIVDFFDAVNKNMLKADVFMDVTTSGTLKNPVQKGRFEINGLSVAVNGKVLPESYFRMLFKGQKTSIDSILYTSSNKDENTQIIGNVISGKNSAIDMTFRSNAKFNNVIRLIDSIAQTFGINDLKTLSATGGVDADFNINSDLKSVKSTGYIKILPASLKYSLYNVSIDDIKSNINLMNNNVIIEDTGFSIMGHPLKLSGNISENSDIDLALTANNLSLKSLLLSVGQLSLLKDNNISSGSLSLNALIKGNLASMKPDITLSVDDVNIFNKPSNVGLVLKNAFIKLLLANKSDYSGDIDINSLSLKLDGAAVSVPRSKIVMNAKNISIKNSYVMLNNSRVDVSGAVKDYANENLNINVKADGNLAASDVMPFIPREFRQMFPNKGIMPLKIHATGNAKEQNIAFDLVANPSGYVQFLNIDKLRGKNTKIHSDIKVKGDNLKLTNSSISANNSQIGTFNGEVTNLSNPNLNIHLIVPENISFTIPGMGQNSNITVNGTVNISGTLDNPKLKGRAYLGDISVKDMDFALTNLIADFNGHGISGRATADKMKFGGIVGTNLSADYSLKDYTNFYLENIVSDAFSGKVTGKLLYNIPKFAFNTDLTGKGLNSMDAVYGAVGIPKTLTGTMNFNAKLNGQGVTDIEIIKSLKGNIDFNINDGRFVSIGRLENLVPAQNITSNSLLKSAIGALSTASALQETNKFKSVSGTMTLSGGSANLTNINVTGPMMSYHVTGQYNIIPNSANLTILGRLDSKVISYLGPLGQLSVQKLVSYIPGFGQATAKMLKLLTIPPSQELLKQIPPLSSGSKKYSDFKVIFNGSVEKASSVKSFMWLSVCDTTNIDLKQEGKNAVKAVKDNINSQIDSTKNTVKNVKKNVDAIVDTQKQNVNAQKQAIEQAKKDIETIKKNAPQSAQNLKNLLKNAAMNANKKAEPAKATVKTETSVQGSQPAKTETKSEPAKTEQNSSAQTSGSPAN